MGPAPSPMKLYPLRFAVAGCLAATTLAAAEVPAPWKSRCADCHGLDGRAHTRLGRKLRIRSLTDPAVQAEFKDEHVAMAIHDGVVDHRGKARMKPITGLSEVEVKALVTYIRSLKREPPPRPPAERRPIR